MSNLSHLLRLKFIAVSSVFGIVAFYSLPTLAVEAVLETPNLADPADADDPAIWIHPTDATKSLVITAVKNGGGRVYDLTGAELQNYSNFAKVDGNRSRLNNVDVQYGFKRADGTRTDIAVASDRGQDVFRVWGIDGNNASAPLNFIGKTERGFATLPNVQPNNDFYSTLDNPVSLQNTVYGMTLYRDAVADKTFILATQRHQAAISQYELFEDASGIHAQKTNEWVFPHIVAGNNLAIIEDNELELPQFEGLVVDQQTGILYAGQEDVGIWRVNLNTGVADSNPFVLTKDFDANSPLEADVEGLSIYYGADGASYLLASSQGDNTFSVFDRKTNQYITSFEVTKSGEGVQESDGADVTNVALPGFAEGLFITQDGFDNDLLDADGELTDEPASTNFKYVSWGDIAREKGLMINTTGYDPRNSVAAVPEPETYALLLAGLGLVGFSARKKIKSIS